MPISTWDVKLCNCAHCFRAILGESMIDLVKERGVYILPDLFRRYQYVAARVKDRPYCHDCSLALGYIDHHTPERYGYERTGEGDQVRIKADDYEVEGLGPLNLET